MVTTCTYRPSLVNIDARNFELSWQQTPPARYRQYRLQYTAPIASAQCNYTSCTHIIINVNVNASIRLINSSLVISRQWSRDSSALEFILSRSRSRSRDLKTQVWVFRSRELKTQVSVLVSRPEVQGLGLGLKTWRPRSRSWSQDSMLGAYACSTITVTCSTFKRVLCHQLELMQLMLWPWDHGLETRVDFVQVSVSVSRPEVQGLGLGLETWRPRSWSWSQDLK